MVLTIIWHKTRKYFSLQSFTPKTHHILWTHKMRLNVISFSTSRNECLTNRKSFLEWSFDSTNMFWTLSINDQLISILADGKHSNLFSASSYHEQKTDCICKYINTHGYVTRCWVLRAVDLYLKTTGAVVFYLKGINKLNETLFAINVVNVHD